MPASPKKSIESARRETEPDSHDAPNSTTNIAALRASASHSTRRYLGSTAGAVEQAESEQQEADIASFQGRYATIGNPVPGTGSSRRGLRVKIGELAAQADCDVQTVRFYEREGLLEAPLRDASGYRRYDQRHVTRLRFVRHLRTLDIPLLEVRQLLAFAARPDQSCGEVNDLLDAHIGLVKQRLQAIRALEGQLLSLRKTCRGDPSHPCAILESFVSAAEQHACACHEAASLTSA